MEISDYLRILRANWWIIVLFGILAAAVALLMTRILPPKYQATAQLFVTAGGGPAVIEAYQGDLFARERVRSYAALAASPQLAERVADQLGDPTTAADVASKVTADPVEDTVLLNITATDQDPERARAISNAAAQQLVKLVYELETSTQGDPPAAGATVVDYGHLPAASQPTPIARLLVSLGAGLVLGLLVAVGYGVLDRRIRDPRTLAIASDTRVMSTVPAGAIAGSSQTLAEDYRELCVQVRETGAKVVAVVSADPQDGRTTVAANLALALAEGEHTVVLVDGDFQAPELAAKLHLAPTPDLTTVLHDPATLWSSLQIWVLGVEVLVTDPAATELRTMAAADGIGEVVKQLRDAHDYIVIDTPPVLHGSAALRFAALSDGVLLVGRSRRGHRGRVEAAVATIKGIHGRLLGSVLTVRTRRGRNVGRA
ncbi:Wzz/FepE/Etk N-terminal domain-containing protein [Rhodococcus tibetensis]|uniref:Wzz/FepE/Etk N-terminal domain-containing protein n=1 Tax=Rhodococcus tibetensis TaxID=2965064 RepID=A0ABT1QF27_9NOCA|nr:Wzz/FepE/Etk N-terminal domain-containing protein [Rhodococcus sp. FXJ9.536]MCQ4120893.1 Wzz/FepE/Etk N-terminal domain-containing protein [Rhodococcus sp. FXJ9.536]